jgi:TRAP-type C4-dicarboxylate transport system permease small subunit
MDRLARVAGALSALCLAGMVGVLVATLALRPLGILVPSSEEFVTFLMVGMAGFGFVYAYVHGAHVRVDTLYRRLRGSAQRAVDVASHLLAALLCAGVAFAGGRLAWTAFRFNDLSDGLVPIPMWIPMSALPIGLALLAAFLVRDGLRSLAGQRLRFAVSEREEALSLAVEQDAQGTP